MIDKTRPVLAMSPARYFDWCKARMRASIVPLRVKDKFHVAQHLGPSWDWSGLKKQTLRAAWDYPLAGTRSPLAAGTAAATGLEKTRAAHRAPPGLDGARRGEQPVTRRSALPSPTPIPSPPPGLRRRARRRAEAECAARPGAASGDSGSAGRRGGHVTGMPTRPKAANLSPELIVMKQYLSLGRQRTAGREAGFPQRVMPDHVLAGLQAGSENGCAPSLALAARRPGVTLRG